MKKRNKILAAGLLGVLAAASAIAADTGFAPRNGGHEKTATGIVEYAQDPETIADAVVIFIPMNYHALDKVTRVERVLNGMVQKQEKGLGTHNPRVIVQKVDSIIAPLDAGVPVRMYLKRFHDRDAYYPIAIFPVSKGAE